MMMLPPAAAVQQHMLQRSCWNVYRSRPLSRLCTSFELYPHQLSHRQRTIYTGAKQEGSEVAYSELANPTLQLLKQITDNFSPERKLGEGMCGQVYKGIHQNEEFAVKLLYSDTPRLTDEQFKNAFDNHRRMNHQNIARLVGYCNIEYEVCARKTTRALCLEYFHNGSLQKYLSGEHDGLDWPTRYKIIESTCQGLKYLHEEFEVYHLDLKPENILLDKNMAPKLTDFGLSNVFSTEIIRPYYEEKNKGYLPLEYVNGDLIADKMFDIYSLGAVIMKIVSGPRSWSQCGGEFIDQVQQNWMRRFDDQKISGSSAEAYCQQVKTCIEIASGCMVSNRFDRFNISQIIDRLNKTASLMNEPRNDKLIDPRPIEGGMGNKPPEICDAGQLAETKSMPGKQFCDADSKTEHRLSGEKRKFDEVYEQRLGNIVADGQSD
ncbi:hypothetical protein ACP4OV_014633 [Aristida adscensionis]